MSTSLTFQYLYVLTRLGDDQYTIASGPFTQPFTVTESGSPDGQLSYDEQVVIAGYATFNVVFKGVVGGDSIVIQDDQLLLLSNQTTFGTATLVSPDIDTPLAICFLPGTLIATPAGEVAVEGLAIGDEVLTADGRAVPVRWIGRQTLLTLFGPPETGLPVVVEAGALDDRVPHTDLRLTADHALILDDVAVNAGALVNGTTIRRIPGAELGARYTVFHIETAGHEVILANGAPAETFVDSVSRARFDNHADYLARYGAEQPLEEMDRPRAASARQVPAGLRARLAARAATLGPQIRAA